MIVRFIGTQRQPKFYSPDLSRNGKEFIISNSDQNGDFAKSISVYADGKLIVSGELVDNKFSFNYDDYDFETDCLHSFTAEINSSETIRKSKASNVEECGEIEAPSVYIDGNNLVIENNSEHATQFDVYVNDVLVLSTTETSVALSNLYDRSTAGLYRFNASAKSDNEKWFASERSDGFKIGVAPNLGVARSASAGGSVGGYAVFAGGHTKDPESISSAVKDVEAYNYELTKIIATALPDTYFQPVAASVGNMLLICGGNSNGCYVIPYDENLTQLNAYTRSQNTRRGIMSGSIGGYAVFAGGRKEGGPTYSDVDAFDVSLTRTNPTALSVPKYAGGCANAGDYLLFAGGYTNGDNEGEVTSVDAYNEELTLMEATALTEGRGWIAGASAGTNALFAGGGTSTGITSDVTAYDEQLTRIDTLTGLTNALMKVASTKLNDCAVFGGGIGVKDGATIVTESYWVYSNELICVKHGDLTDYGVKKSAASIGDMALFTGGVFGSTPRSTVDVIILN